MSKENYNTLSQSGFSSESDRLEVNIVRRLDGTIWREEYRQEDDKSVIIERNKDSTISREEHYKNGGRHREGDKPAKVYRRPDGTISREIYYKNDKLPSRRRQTCGY